MAESTVPGELIDMERQSQISSCVNKLCYDTTNFFNFIQFNNCVVIMFVQMRLCTTALYIIYIQEIVFSGASLSVYPFKLYTI